MEIKLNKLFYKKEAIISALSAYQETCSGKVVETDKELIVEFDDDNFNGQKLKNEFCNYVLGCMK
ncbi:HxsD-like protein [Nanoarchaeota archaeon]